MLPRRLGAYSQTWLDQLTTGGEIVWIGAGPLNRSGRVALYFREDVRLAGPPPSNAKLERPEGRVHDAIRELLATAPAFWLDIAATLDARARGAPRGALGPRLGRRGDQRRLRTAARAAAARRRSRGAPRPALLVSPAAPPSAAVQGRWSLTEQLFRNAPPAGPRQRAQAELMLERYGIVTRETVLSEGVPGGFSTLYGELSNLEMLGTARRGYFVEGLGGAQFALAGAVERLRSLPQPEGEHQILAATDPAQPYGAQLAWPRPAELHEAGEEEEGKRGGRRPSRIAGAYVVLRDGEPVIYIERGGKGIQVLARLSDSEIAAALDTVAADVAAGRLPRLGIERIDGEPGHGFGARGGARRGGLQAPAEAPRRPGVADVRRLCRRAAAFRDAGATRAKRAAPASRDLLSVAASRSRRAAARDPRADRRP